MMLLPLLVDGGARTIVVRGFAGPLPSGVASDRAVSVTTFVNRTP